jgi:hypothetical protein
MGEAQSEATRSSARVDDIQSLGANGGRAIDPTTHPMKGKKVTPSPRRRRVVNIKTLSPFLLGPLFASGCGGGLFAETLLGGTDGSYDSQACVERSLRRGPLPEAEEDAPRAFRDACADG